MDDRAPLVFGADDAPERGSEPHDSAKVSRLAHPTPAWSLSFILGNGALGIGFTGKRAALDLGDMGGERLGLSGLRLAIRLLVLLGQLSGIQRDKSDGGQAHVTLLIFHLHLASDAAPI